MYRARTLPRLPAPLSDAHAPRSARAARPARAPICARDAAARLCDFDGTCDPRPREIVLRRPYLLPARIRPNEKSLMSEQTIAAPIEDQKSGVSARK